MFSKRKNRKNVYWVEDSVDILYYYSDPKTKIRISLYGYVEQSVIENTIKIHRQKVLYLEDFAMSGPIPWLSLWLY